MSTVKVKQSNIDGYGVFANVNIKKNATILCNVIPIKKDDVTKKLIPYLYPWSKNTSCFCIGFGNYFNHSISPSIMIYKIDKILNTKTFKFLKNIKRGEEILLNYGPNVNFKINNGGIK